jgi:hypothetical protein
MKKIIPVLTFVILFCNCSNKKKNGNFYVPTNSQTSISISKLSFDSIPLDSITTSYVIESNLHDSSIYVMDRFFCTLYTFDLNGHFKFKKLGSGHAKGEIPVGRIATHTFLNNGNLFILDYNCVYRQYDKDILLSDFFKIRYDRSKRTKDKEEFYQNPIEYTQFYEDMVCRSYKNNVYFNARASSNECCYVNNTAQHLKNNSNILEVKLDDQDFGRLLATGFPPSYQENSLQKAILCSVNYDIDLNGNFYVTYEADSLIRQYDNDYNELKCFGYAGIDMDLNYKTITTLEESRKNWRNERLTKGYYNWLEYVDETGLLFRSYQKGETRSTDGLQIYKDGVLIGDVSVPKGLKVMGYIAPYYYSYVIPNEEKEFMYLYRFKL